MPCCVTSAAAITFITQSLLTGIALPNKSVSNARIAHCSRSTCVFPSRRVRRNPSTVPDVPRALSVLLAFEAFEGLADDGFDGGHFIVGQLVKLAFAPLAA